MDELETEQFCWRDTYFVWFDAARRPSLKQIQQTLDALPEHYTLQTPEADDAGGFESITLLSRTDHSALEISFLAGEDLGHRPRGPAAVLKR